MDALQAWGIDLIIAIQLALPGLDEPMRFLSFLGTSQFFTYLIPLLLWCVHRGLGVRFMLLVVTGDALNGVVKLVFHDPRPYWLSDRVRAGSVELSYGVPSGHAQSSITAWLVLAHAARRAWIWVAAVLLILAVSFSRLYLGMHFPHDVALGWLIGLALVSFFWWIEPRLIAWLKRLPPAGRYGAALVLPAILLAMWAAALARLSGIVDPLEWEQQAALAAPPVAGEMAINPRQSESLFTEIGVLLGAGLGLAAAYGRWGFDAGGPLVKRAARFALGIVGLLVLQLGLGAIFPDEPLALGLALRALRYALIGFWVVALAPAIFLKLNLAEKQIPA